MLVGSLFAPTNAFGASKTRFALTGSYSVIQPPKRKAMMRAETDTENMSQATA